MIMNILYMTSSPRQLAAAQRAFVGRVWLEVDVSGGGSLSACMETKKCVELFEYILSELFQEMTQPEKHFKKYI